MTTDVDSCRPVSNKDSFAILSIAVMVFFGCRILGATALGDFPNSADEFAYLYQAHIFADGSIGAKAHPHQEALSPFYIIEHGSKVFSIFPPGWPAALSVGVYYDLTMWINPLFAALTVPIIWSMGMRLGGRTTAWTAIALTVASPMFAFNSASLFSHTACLLGVTATAWLLMRWLESSRPLDALAAGAIAAWAFTTREYTALLVLSPLACYTLLMSTSKARLAIYCTIGAAPIVSAYIVYSAILTGQWLIPVRFMLESERLGFGERIIRVFDYVETQVFTPTDALGMLARNLGRLMIWTLPGLPLLAVWGAWRHRHEPWVWAMAASASMLPLGYLLYPAEGGNQYGPRFYYEGLTFIALLGARSLAYTPKRRLGIIVSVGVIASLPFWSYWISQHNEQIRLRKTLFTLVEHRNLDHALVFIGAPSGDMTQGDLIRNLAPIENQSVVYAWDLGSVRNRMIWDAFPSRDAYFFGRDTRTGVWYLERLSHSR